MALVVCLAPGVVQTVAAQAPALVLSETTLTVEEAMSASYTVKLATQPTGEVEVSIGGMSGTDLSVNPTSLTFTTSNWEAAQPVAVSAAGDDDATHDGATLTHTASGGNYGTVTANLAVTVTDTTRMPLSAMVTRHVQEGDSTPIRATLPMPLDEDVIITVEVVEVTGNSNEYELSVNRTLTIAAGATESTGEVIFTSLDDFMGNGTRQFEATLTADHSRVDPHTTLILVLDDDQTRTFLQIAPSTIFEAGGEATLLGYKLHLHEGVVRMTVSLEPSDRATLSSTTLTFEPGALYATETLTITAKDNDAAEGDQTISITATVIEGRGVRAPPPLTLTIMDDDGASPQVALRLTPPRVREALVSTVTAVASHPLDVEAAITVSASPGHADTLTSDYALSTNTVLTIPAGGMRSTGTVTIATVDDHLYGGGRRKEVTVSGTVTRGGVANPADQTLTVLDDDRALQVILIATPSTISEGETSTITLRALDPVPADVTVTVSTSSDAAEVGGSNVLTIREGDTDSTGGVTVTAIDDDDMSNANVPVAGTLSDESTFARVRSATVIVIDDDVATTRVVVSVAPEPLTIYEGETSSILVQLSQPVSTDVVVTIEIDETDFSHTATDDEYTLSANRMLTVRAGSMRSMDVVSLTATDDEYYGPLYFRRVAFEVVSVTGLQNVKLQRHADWVIFDDESQPRVTFDVEPTSIAERGGQSTVTASLNTKLRYDAEVTVTTAPVGAAGPGDFIQTGTALTIPAGTKTSTGTVTISAVDDDVDGPDKHLVITGAVDSTAGVWAPLAEGLEIRDDDGSVTDDEGASQRVRLEVDPKQVREDAGATAVSVTAVLTAGERQSDTMVRVTVEEQENEYGVSPAMFEMEIPMGGTRVVRQFMLTPVDDEQAEADREIPITGITTDGIPVDPAAVTLVDDDGGGGESNRPPKLGQKRYTFDLPENRSGREMPVPLGTVSARDPDGDRIRYALFAGDRERFAVSRGSGTVSYIGEGEDFESGPPQFELQVTAKDDRYTAKTDVLVRVVDLPEAPEAADDRTETPEDTPKVIDVLSNDSDPDGDRLRVASVSAPEHGTTAVVSGGIRYAPDLNWHGTDRFAYTVADAGGLKATVRVRVTPVNDPPEAVDDEAETLEDEAAIVDVLANDTDVDGDPLQVVSVGSAGHGATATAAGGVRYSPELNWYGTDRFTYTIADPEGLTATATVTMTVLPVNDAPEAVGVIPDQALEEGGVPATVDLSPYFTDVDGDVLTYEAVSSDEAAVTTAVSGSTLTLSAVVTGTATVTVTASDVEGLTATQTFGVRVGDRLVRAVMTDALAALGRGHLSSARMTIGRLLEPGGGGMTRMMVAGRQWSPDAWDRMGGGSLQQSHELLFRAATLQQRRSATDLVGTSADPRLRRPGALGMLGGGFGGPGGGRERLLQGTDVLLSFGGAGDAAGGGGARWRVWGQGDMQSFRGAPAETSGYDGDLRTAYVGVDTRLSERWLAGVAVARSGGTGDWQVGSSSGRLTTELTVLHPYVRWGDRETSVWALAGVGRGRAENVRTLTGRRGDSPLGLALGLLEARRRLATTAGGLEVDLRGEASWARLRTGAGEQTVDELEAGVRRVRTGVEVTLPLGAPGGIRFAPFGAVSTRHDGGAGQTGVGLEVAGGLRVSGGRVRIEAQGRMLALHTATDYEERGASVTASVGGGYYEPGLTASVRPRWGAPGYGAESLWHDQLQAYTDGGGRNDGGIDGRVGYGLRLPDGRLLTPFGGYGQMGSGRRMQIGANLGMAGLFGGNADGPVQVEFMGERYVRPRAGADHRFTLFGIINFGARSR